MTSPSRPFGGVPAQLEALDVLARKRGLFLALSKHDGDDRLKRLYVERKKRGGEIEGVDVRGGDLARAAAELSEAFK